MKTIITIQHTESVHHTNGMVGSWTDWDLTDLGKEQAHTIGKNLAQQLKDTNYKVYASDLLRAKKTAEIIAKHLGTTVALSESLRERNLGKAVGKSVAWLKENLECQEKTIDDKLFHDAESKRAVWNRLIPFYESLLESEDEHILIVSHGETLSIFNALWLGLDVEMLNTCDLYGNAGGVSFLNENQDGKRIIRRLSDMSYLK